MNVSKLITDLEKKHPGESEYLQAVREVLESVEEVYNMNPQFEICQYNWKNCRAWQDFYIQSSWADDKGGIHVNLVTGSVQ